MYVNSLQRILVVLVKSLNLDGFRRGLVQGCDPGPRLATGGGRKWEIYSLCNYLGTNPHPVTVANKSF